MLNQFSRTELLLGDAAMKKLKNSRVAVFGVGGVGGYTVEALTRSGVGAIDLIDNDTVSLTNINRQIIATLDTVGRYKVDVAEERIKSINPDCKVVKHKCFFLPETADEFDFNDYDYVVDAIDTVKGKLEIIVRAKQAETMVISSMGAGNKLDPTAFEVADISKTSVCPLAKTMRVQLRKMGINHLKVVYSKEAPIVPRYNEDSALEQAESVRRALPGSTAFVPSVVGLIIAGEVVKDLIK
ncbi:ThiF family adenylyltransferase [uncultured Eubacterium sp.]|uniref:tRNA threonylcarbamoyladenosine dehydratase n=1 Tax=uncultured Eubacterium sp. TaxID=165185 RepID=UPI0015ABFDB0|nr:tRNA threonylcarbamoyladenosine dehydratase [uncultured Eubacterium sp.]